MLAARGLIVHESNNVTLDNILIFASERLNISKQEARYFLDKNSILDYPIFYCNAGTIVVMQLDWLCTKILLAYLKYLGVQNCTIHMDNNILDDD